MCDFLFFDSLKQKDNKNIHTRTRTLTRFTIIMDSYSIVVLEGGAELQIPDVCVYICDVHKYYIYLSVRMYTYIFIYLFIFRFFFAFFSSLAYEFCAMKLA